METNSKFKRNFLIFEQEDGGYGSNNEPSGYVKTEIKEGKGKLTASIQNLRENLSGSKYRLYLFCLAEKKVFSVNAGDIFLVKGNGNLNWSFNPENVASTGRKIDDFLVYAIISLFRDKKAGSFICPLAAYVKKRISWRERVKSIIEFSGDTGNRSDDNSQYSQGKANKSDKNDILNTKYNYNYIDSEIIGRKENWDSTSGLNERNTKESENTECIFNRCSENYDSDRTNGYNPCANCYLKKINHSGITKDGEVNRNISGAEKGSINHLVNLFNKCFESNDPFGSNRKDYTWWKVGSPVCLNNILYQCNIKAPHIFNPAAMMSHFKYRFLIIGIYYDKERQREYLVCGIPGVYGIDESPYGNMCRWVPQVGSKLNYGVFGYWIAYIDPRTGNFQSLR